MCLILIKKWFIIIYTKDNEIFFLMILGWNLILFTRLTQKHELWLLMPNSSYFQFEGNVGLWIRSKSQWTGLFFSDITFSNCVFVKVGDSLANAFQSLQTSGSDVIIDLILWRVWHSGLMTSPEIRPERLERWDCLSLVHVAVVQ